MSGEFDHPEGRFHRQQLDAVADLERLRERHKVLAVSPVVAAADMQRHLRARPRHGMDERLQASIRTDGLREPIRTESQPRIGTARRCGTVACLRQGKDVQHRHQLDAIKLGVGLGDHGRRRRAMPAPWQKPAFDHPHEGDFTGSSDIVGALSGMEILGIVTQRRAMQLRCGRRGWQCGNIVGDIKLGGNGASGGRQARRLGIVRRDRQPWRNAACLRTPGSRDRLGCPCRHPGPQRRRASSHNRPRRPGDDLLIEGTDKGRLVPGDHRDAISRAMQRIGFLHHAGVGGDVAGADNANRSAHQRAFRGSSKARAIAEASSAR